MSSTGAQRHRGVSNLSRNFNRAGGNTSLEAQNTENDIDKTIKEILLFSRMVSIPHTLTGAVPDPDDHKVLECAVVGSATHIVAGDRRHLLPLGSYQGIAIVSAAEFLALVATL